jgi:hypothetical protein
MSQRIFRGAAGVLFVLVFLGFATAALAQDPSPRRFVENLDVRCYKIATPLNFPLQLDHLNPLFREWKLPPEHVNLDPQQLCVPVYKNDKKPPDEVVRYLRYVDWRCHQISGPPLNLSFKVDHLNPIIAEMFGPRELITVREPQQLCVPVAKDDVFPPEEVLRLVQWLDVKCYRVESERQIGGEAIKLTHLNPLFDGKSETTYFEGPSAFQLCVPVAKNGNYPPDDVIRYIEYSDVLCYKLRGEPLNRIITLTHLNPVLSDLPREQVRVTDSEKLCVPVAKDGRFPPD